VGTVPKIPTHRLKAVRIYCRFAAENPFAEPLREGISEQSPPPLRSSGMDGPAKATAESAFVAKLLSCEASGFTIPAESFPRGQGEGVLDDAFVRHRGVVLAAKRLQIRTA
jgi:hypothetical protein